MPYFTLMAWYKVTKLNCTGFRAGEARDTARSLHEGADLGWRYFVLCGLLAALRQCGLDERHFPAKHLGGFAAELRLFFHDSQEVGLQDVDGFDLGQGLSTQAIGVASKGRGQSQNRADGKQAVKFGQAFDSH